jgi:hypothetical protein
MVAPAIWRWILLRLARNPSLAILALLTLVGFPLLARMRLMPLGPESVRAWCFPAGLAGVVLALIPLSRGASFLARVAPRDRTLGELGALTLAGLYLQVPIIGSALLGGVEARDLARALPVILTADLQLAGIALLLLSTALSTAARASLFLAAAVAVPALGRGLRPVAPLDAGLALREPSPSAILGALCACAALVLAAHLLRTVRARPAAA